MAKSRKYEVIRVRFAPSPTGYLHIGGLRTALYNWLFARQNKGKFILRIEDTDVKRKVPGAVESLIGTLNLVGLDYDEGPYLVKVKSQKSPHQNKFGAGQAKIKNKTEFIIKQKGRYRPYIQSQRLHIYQNLAQKLVDQGHAYYCFCTEKDLEKMRQEQMEKKLPPMYDERCRKLSKDEINKKIKNKIPYVIRLKVPEEGSIKFYDLIRGEVEFDLKNIDDQVIIKSDSYPTYHLANVTDDHLMNVTHVIRGEEWLPSTPKHILLYQFFNWTPPKFAHLPLLLNPDHSKLSKRQGDVAVEDYLAKGYLPEAILNFIAFLGWNPGDKREIFSLKELVKSFSLKKIQKAGAVFNREKLVWLNGYYIRKTPVNELTKRCIPYLIRADLVKFLNPKSKIPNPKQIQSTKFQIYKTKEVINFNWLKKIVALEQQRMKTLSDLPEMTDFFFQNQLKYDPQILAWGKMKREEIIDCLKLIKEKIQNLSVKSFKKEKIQDILNKLAKEKGSGQVFWPFRVALSGKKSSPPPAEIAEILSQQKTLQRIDEAILLLNL